jgi:hypothetical protein
MTQYRLLLSLTLAAALPAHAANGVHVYYDEDGQPVYSQFAPTDGRETRTVKPPPPPAEAPEVARQRLNERLQQFQDNREDEQLAAQETAEADTKAGQARQRCESARKNLELLNGPPRVLFQTSDGVRRLTEDERQSRRAEMEKIIAEDCK